MILLKLLKNVSLKQNNIHLGLKCKVDPFSLKIINYGRKRQILKDIRIKRPHANV